MKNKKMGITAKITLLVVAAVFISVVSILSIAYRINYEHLEVAAGEELIGCANITTILTDPDEVKKALAGDKVMISKIENDINWTVDHKGIFLNTSILSLDGHLIAVDKNLEKEGFKAGDAFPIDKKTREKIIKTKHPQYSDIYTYGEYERKTGYAPIFEDHDPTKEIIALVAIDFESSIIKERAWDMIAKTIQFGGIFPIIAALFAILYTRKMIQPIKKLNEQVKKIASGDLKVEEIYVKKNDEIGDLTLSFNGMAGNLRTLIEYLQKTVLSLSSTSEQLNRNAGKTNESNKFNVYQVEEIAKGCMTQSELIQKNAMELTEAIAEIDKIKEKTKEVKELSNRTKKESNEGERAIRQTKEQMETIHLSVEQSATDLKVLEERSKKIEEIVEIISSVSIQTNLLALNASIEAARAGEAGRGFSVVAEEIKKLADNTKKYTAEITGLITGVQKDTAQVIHSMEASVKGTVNGITIVQTTGELFGDIHTSTCDINNEMEAVITLAEKISTISNEVLSSFESLHGISIETTKRTENVRESTNEHKQAVEEVVATSTHLQEEAGELTKKIDRYII